MTPEKKYNEILNDYRYENFICLAQNVKSQDEKKALYHMIAAIKKILPRDGDIEQELEDLMRVFSYITFKV